MHCLRAAVFTLAIACSALAQTYSVKTFAGGALPENVAGNSASLGNIYGITSDSSGNYYLSLTDYDIVVKMDANTGVLTRLAGTGSHGYSGDGGAANQAQLANPTGLAIDTAGNLYIADSGNNRVRRVTPSGTISTFAGTGLAGYSGDNGPAAQAQISGLGDLALDSSGNLYLADFYNHVVRRVASGTITTVAGNGVYGFSGDNGPATSAQLAGPSGIVLDAAGNLYIAEVYNNRVRKVSSGIITTVAGNGTAGFTGDKGLATAATLRQPSDVALDSAGNLYIADYGNNRVRMVAPNGTITTFAGSGAAIYNGDHIGATGAGLVSPQRITTDPAGNLYIADGGRVRKVANTLIVTMAGGAVPAGENGPAAQAQLLSPQGVATDAVGNVYITDSGNGRVLKVAGGVLTRLAGTGGLPGGGDGAPPTLTALASPSGVAVDSSGAVYIADSLGANVRKLSGGQLSIVAGGGTTLGDNGPATKAQLSNPLGLAIDGSGTLYIADLNRIRMVLPDGTISTVAGNGSAGYQGDGAVATAAMISGVGGVAFDPTTSSYLIADSGNNRIRTVSNGIINTLAGNGTYGFTTTTGAPTGAQLGAPPAVAVDATGTVYATDANRILKITKSRITAIAGIANPQGLAVDVAGNIYVADPSNHRVRVLTPAGTTCAVTLGAAPPVAPSTGGLSASVAIQTAANCPWAVENLPTWITVPSGPYGVGPTTLTLALDVNRDAPRTATLVIGGVNIVIGQAGTATILGQVTLRGATPLAGVTFTLSGGQAATATSDSGGNFSFAGLPSAGSYTVTPSLAGYIFLPASQTVSNVTANPTLTFTAWTAPQVSALAPTFPATLQPAPANFAAGQLVTLYGTGLCGDGISAVPTLPDRLGACIVQVDGTNVRLYYAGPAQINAVLPQNLATGPHRLVVQRYTDTTYKTIAVSSTPLSFTIDRIALDLLERADGSARVLTVQYPDGGFAGASRPLHAGNAVALYLSGLGRKAQTFAEGAAPHTVSSAVENVQITVAGLPAAVLYAGVQPDYPGLDQVTLQLPNFTVASGASTVTLQITAPATGQTLRYEINAN